MKVGIIEISDEAYDLLKSISTYPAEYRDPEFETLEDFEKSDKNAGGLRNKNWFMNRNYGGTYYLIPELTKYGLVDVDTMCWHTTYVITDLGKEFISKISISQTEEDYYECPRCEINSLDNTSMCPCPRGGCEAVIAGTLKTVKTLDRTLNEEQIKWNQENR